MKKKLFISMLTFMMGAMLSIGLTSCSKDNISEDNLEGTWGLVHSEGYYKDNNGNKVSWDIDFNPLSPSSSSDLKTVILNTTNNTYLFTQYYWSTYSNTWKFDSEYKAQLKGKILIYNGEEINILKLTSTQLIIEAEMDSRYGKQTFRKLSSID